MTPVLHRFCRKIASLGWDLFALDAGESKPEGWITLENGVHVPVKEGQSKKEATKSFVAKKETQKTASSSGSGTPLSYASVSDRLKSSGWAGSRKSIGNMVFRLADPVPGKNLGFIYLYVEQDGKRKSTLSVGYDKTATSEQVAEKIDRVVSSLAQKAGQKAPSPAKPALKPAQANPSMQASAPATEHHGAGQPRFSEEAYAGAKAQGTAGKLAAAQFAGMLTQKQRDALIDYSGSPDINATLRRQDKLHPSEVEALSTLDSIFDRAKTKKPLTVYRGVGEAMGQAPWVKDLLSGGLKEGGRIHDDGFMSTSADMGAPKEALEESKVPVMLKIDVPKGAKAVSLYENSSFPEQNEILLNRGSDMRIKKIQKTKKLNSSGSEGFLVHAELV